MIWYVLGPKQPNVPEGMVELVGLRDRGWNMMEPWNLGCFYLG